MNVEDRTGDAPPRGRVAEEGGQGNSFGREVALPMLLFAATVASVYWVGEDFWGSGWQLAGSLMAILVAHEAGHYLAARWHGERPTLPFFLPLPWHNPFGTLGAVLFLGDQRRSRAALLDIGVAGPLAGLTVALPLLALGLALSPVEPQATANYAQEGQSIVYWAAKRILLGPIPPNHDVIMHPVLGAAWAGLYITFLNLLPIGQLDGGHVAYALLGRRQAILARWLTFLPYVLAVYNVIVFMKPCLQGAAATGTIWTVVSAALPWLLLGLLILAMQRLGAYSHSEPADEMPLDRGRRWVGWSTLAWFVLLFMPSPWVVH
ncbi:MAG: site-2 protease family protein [Polyangiaceae bacterium]|nr:site-2 protease family protein [Polyangiaceae bacterium]